MVAYLCSTLAVVAVRRGDSHGGRRFGSGRLPPGYSSRYRQIVMTEKSFISRYLPSNVGSYTPTNSPIFTVTCASGSNTQNSLAKKLYFRDQRHSLVSARRMQTRIPAAQRLNSGRAGSRRCVGFSYLGSRVIQSRLPTCGCQTLRCGVRRCLVVGAPVRLRVARDCVNCLRRRDRFMAPRRGYVPPEHVSVRTPAPAERLALTQ
jgi:hypothetical protein